VVSPEVREKLLTGQLQLGGETCWVSVIFSDIRGFSSLSETMIRRGGEPAQRIHDEMEAVNWGGYINNFIGDAIVAVFGAPIAHEDVEWRAVAAALSMREHLRRLNHRRRERGAPEIRIGIGISTGEAWPGKSFSQRLLYTVIGDAVSPRRAWLPPVFRRAILMNGQTPGCTAGTDAPVNHA
jgi:class 3 adenylate cyclase